MSFSDLMSSAKGPGAIGLLLGLTVLAGFIILGTMTLDHRFLGGESIESAIRNQDEIIEGYRVQLKAAEENMSDMKSRQKIADALASASVEINLRQSKLAERKLSVLKATEEIDTLKLTVEDYKAKYRSQVREAARGKRFASFETLDGAVYHDVIIREVNPIGILISHRDGSKRIPYASLPRETQDLYQFDPDEKRKQEEVELLRRKKHLLATEATERARQKNEEEARAEQKIAQAALRRQSITELTARITTLTTDITNLERDIEAQAYKSISRAPIMRQQLAKMRADLEKLEAQLSALRSTQ